jgi:PAS domain S-box-containing protein
MTKDINKYKQLLSDISFEALFLSHNGICIAQNETAKKIFGYSDEEAIGQPGTNWIHPMDRKLVSQKMQENIASPYEVLALRKDGSIFPCEIQAKIVEFEGENIRVTALRDISTRKTIEKELFDKIVELEIITASIPNAIWKVKIDSEGNASDVYISDSVNDLLALPPGTIKNDWKKYFSFVVSEEIEEINKKIKESIGKPEKIYSHTYRIRKGDGKIAWVTSAGRVRLIDDEAILYGFTYDVSELKENEKALKELNASKDKLFSIISHDLKNPFTAFMGFSELMIRQLEAGKTESLMKYAEAILLGAQQGSELLSNLLDWSRTQRDKVTFNPEMIDLQGLVRTIQNYYQHLLQSKEIEFIYVNEGVTSFVGDRMMIETTLRNLLSNAIKFSKRKGEIKLNISSDKFNVVFTIIDNGVGISEEKQKKLFNLNSSITTLGTENEKGTGLGLVLCKEFIDFHGGKIGVESKVNNGSKFWFSIPKK